ncbi:tape measure protein, partial [Thauera sp.]|uniref:tape measure protein n=1 Tax=Thauera sp. TaxID=1905334 RepID=UPI00257F8560
GLNSLTDAARNVLQTGSAFEQLERRLVSLLGSQQAATEVFAQIKELARTTPFEVSALTEAYAKLTAFGLRPTMSQMMALADTAATLGGGTEALAGITLALGQAWTKGKLQGEELLQLAERGVPVWDLLAQVTGRNTVELQKMASAGELGRDVIVKLIGALGNANAGASAELMQTYAGSVSNAKDALDEFYTLIADAGVLDFLTGRIQSLLAEFERLKETGELQEWAADISDAMINVATAIEAAIEAIAALSGAAEILLKVVIARKVLSYGDALAGLGAAGAAGAAGVSAAATATGALGAAGAASAAGVSAAATATGELATKAGKAIPLLTKLRNVLGVGIIIGGIESIQAAVTAYLDMRKAQAEADQAIARAEASAQRLRDSQSPAAVAARAEAQAMNERIAALSAHKQRVEAIKAEELANLRQVLNSQVKAYDDATKGIEAALRKQEAAQNRTKNLAQSNKDFIAGLGQRQTGQQASSLDASAQITKARGTLGQGDLEGAIRQAERAKQIVQQLDESGQESTLVLQYLAKQIAQIQDEAAKGLEAEAAAGVEKERARAAEIQQLITDTVAKAEWLKQLEVDFDKAGAEASADQLRQALEQKLAANPIVIPAVVVSKSSVDGRVDDLLGDLPQRAYGGPLPGTAHHDRSDNMLYWGTPGEWVIDRPTVRRYGTRFMRDLLAGRVPRYAYGGEIGGASVLNRVAAPSLPVGAGGGQSAGAGDPLVLDFGRLGKFNATVQRDVRSELIRAFRIVAIEVGGRR